MMNGHVHLLLNANENENDYVYSLMNVLRDDDCVHVYTLNRVDCCDYVHDYNSDNDYDRVLLP